MAKFFNRSTLPLLILVISICCYSSAFISPIAFWPSSIMSFFTPVLIVVNILLLIFYITRRSKRLLFPFIAVILGLPFIWISINFNTTTESSDGFSVLSFNSKLFREENTYDYFSEESIAWVVNDTSSIKCIQEFCTNDQLPGLDIYGRIKKEGYYGYNYDSQTRHSSGLAIFSKFPILKSGTLFDRKLTVNNIIYADIKIRQNIVRVYNVHLSSMSILLDELKSTDNTKDKYADLINKLRNGGIERAKEIDVLIDHASNSPHPVIICGDFNEIPYSYNYFRLRNLYRNSFEKAGNGFGFTFNSILFFLRIDHQFFSDSLKAKVYEVDKSNMISDHFATRGYYEVKEE